jgi:INO80 complex subunit C
MPSPTVPSPSLDEYITAFAETEKFKNPHRSTKRPRYKGGRLVLNEEQRRLSKIADEEREQGLTPKQRTTHFSIAAPPSLRPVKRYCDITGLPAKYTSPHNQIRYHNKECYSTVKNMPAGVDQQYLSLRGANVVLK